MKRRASEGIDLSKASAEGSRKREIYERQRTRPYPTLTLPGGQGCGKTAIRSDLQSRGRRHRYQRSDLPAASVASAT